MKTLFLLILLGLCAYCDVKERKIPNILIVAGIVTGLLFLHSISDVGYALLSIFIIFALNALKLMGAGDAKLWMVIACYMGFWTSCIAVLIAAFLLIGYSFFVNREESTFIVKNTAFQIFTTKKMIVMDQKGYPFAPFLFCGVFIIFLWGLLF